ncbi:family 20 glycosylhydrolase [Winogradskyella sp.]|uniref:beta-N-acetylhexosaminidase n=1 Tax=Winogradskyella sp. TaxID=1883156 RepID=UPI001B25E866|nr:family 20 glycosylhydrolase [Winogradskyella sp.]MBO6879870.1 family 20 glycosylhydrolase [Winogradskyella sp.]
MHFKKIAFVLLLSVFIFGCVENEVETAKALLIPAPVNQEFRDGQFVLSSETTIHFEDEFSVAGNFLTEFLKLGLKRAKGVENRINFVKDSTISNPEGYTIEVNPIHIEISAATAQGAFYAVQSLRQLLPAEFETGKFKGKDIAVSATIIKDHPQFQYRGMHLDVSRHMFSVEFIKKYIDALAMLKMNTFHWHLTDDQGWRIEIKKYPKLQEVAAFRDETLIGHYSDQPHQFDGKRYGGFYTQDEIKDIVAYAKKRFVTVIPEIEMPGHAQAAIAAYPELGCTGEQIEVVTKWGVFEDIYCPNEKTFTFLEDVLDEVIELFPSTYIHIGGDEAPKTRWKNCEHCQALIKTEGLKDEHELQSYFITKMEKYLNSKGRQIIGWDEILEGGLAPNATVMSWRGTSGAVEAAKSGHNVVMTPTSHCYFDYYQSENEDEPLAIGGFLPLEKVYEFNPIPEELTEEESKYVLGAQGNVWTEYMPTKDQVEYMAFPRMLAMSEVVWSKPKNKNYEDFVSRLEKFHKRLDALDINYANHLYEIEGNMVSKNDTTYYELKTLTDGKTIRYTLDGSEPDSKAQIYKSQLPITESTMLKSAVFKEKKQLGKTFTQDINFHKAVGAKITIDKEPHKAYSGSGAEGLINGINGSDSRYGDKEWLGFWGEDIEITIEFDSPKEIETISTRFHNGNGQWIYAPLEVEIEVEEEIEKIKLQTNDKNIVEFKLKKELKGKTIKLKIPNYGTIPEGKQGGGNKAWTFIDEIIVN